MHLLGNHTNHHTNHHPSPRDPVRGSRQIVSLGWSWVLGRGSWVVGRGSRIIGRGRGRQREAEGGRGSLSHERHLSHNTAQRSTAQPPKIRFWRVREKGAIGRNAVRQKGGKEGKVEK